MIKSLRFRILLITLSIILIVTATFMLFSRKEVEGVMTRFEQDAAKNVLQLVKLNIENEYNVLVFHQKTTTEKYERQLKYLGEIVITYIDELYEKTKKGALSTNTAKSLAIEGVKRFRYGEDNYFFIMDKAGVLLSHPDPTMMQRDISNLIDINGKNIGQSFIDIALDEGEGYSSYWWKKLSTDTPQKKLTYVKFYPQWKWIIGTGVYIDEIQEEVEKQKNAILEELRNTLSKIKIAKTGYLYVFDGKKKMLIHPNLSGEDTTGLKNPYTGKSIIDELNEASKNPDTPFEYPWDKPSDRGQYKYWKQSYVTYFEPLDWYICSSVYIDEMKEPGKALSQKIFFISLCFFVIATILSLLFARTLTIPITNLVKVMKQVKSEGLSNTRAPVSGTTETKELGTIFNTMLDSINRAIKAKDEYEKKARENEKLAMVGKTASILAHDVRKPFSIVKSVVEMFEIFKKNPATLESAKTSIDNSIRHVESMINDIMDFSREMVLEVKPELLVPIFDFTIQQIAQHIKKIDISLIYKFQHTRQPMVDSERISRVFANILLNGVEAIRDIGKRDRGVIDISTYDRNNGTETVIVIGNDGPIFSEEDLPKLFDYFFTKGKKKGTGIGLASAQKIIALHNGTITAQNKLDGKGVEFIITVPSSAIIEKNDISMLPHALNETFSIDAGSDENKIGNIINKLLKTKKTYKILLLEDEALYRASVRNTIKNNPELDHILTLYEVQNVDDALTLLNKENITHAIVDIDLHDTKDGFDFLSEVQSKHPRLKSIVHSNRFTQEDQKKANTLGALAFVPKPLNIVHLVEFLLEKNCSV